MCQDALRMLCLGRRLPRQVLTVPEIARVFAVPDTRTRQGLRDRAILDVFYATGIRRMELSPSVPPFDGHAPDGKRDRHPR